MSFFGLSPSWSGSRLQSSCLISTISCLVFIAGCEWHGAEYPTETGARSLVVHGMLGLGAQDQEIIVEYSRGIGEGYYRGLTPASGAEVVVVGDEAHRFAEDPDRPGVYRATFAIRAGARYALQVRGPTGEAATSETVVPDASRLIAPGADTTIALGNFVTLVWSSVPTAGGYIVIDRPPGEPGPYSELLHPSIVGDTSATGQPGIFGGKSFHYRVATVDSNYVRYMQGGLDDSGAGRIRTTISGAYGLFGSYALSNARTVTIR